MSQLALPVVVTGDLSGQNVVFCNSDNNKEITLTRVVSTGILSEKAHGKIAIDYIMVVRF